MLTIVSRKILYGFIIGLALLFSCGNNPNSTYNGNPLIGTWDMTQMVIASNYLTITIPASDSTVEQELIIDSATYTRTVMNYFQNDTTVDSGSYTVSGDTITAVSFGGTGINYRYFFPGGTGLSLVQADSASSITTNYIRR